jgi:hypothetical protein
MEPEEEDLELPDLAPEDDCDWLGGVPLLDPDFDEEEW